jgi:type III secretory pathway component EscV
MKWHNTARSIKIADILKQQFGFQPAEPGVSFVTLSLQLIVTVSILTFVTVAVGQTVFFDLTPKTKKAIVLHTAIGRLGLWSAAYGLFLGQLHYEDWGWGLLVISILAICFIGSLAKKARKKRLKQEQKTTQRKTKKRKDEKKDDNKKADDSPPDVPPGKDADTSFDEWSE